jgi:hypothetical protein
MIRRVTVAAVASIFAIGVAGPATAGGGHSAKPYKASLTAVNPAATTAGLASIRGRARLVDGKKNNKASLHMRNLAAGTMYLWHVHEGTCAATGSPVPGWTYRTQVGAKRDADRKRVGQREYERQVGDVQRRSCQALLRERPRGDAYQRPAGRHHHRLR